MGRLWGALHIDCDQAPTWKRGRAPLCLSGWPTTGRHREVPAAPTLLVIIIAAGTWSGPRAGGDADAAGAGGLGAGEGVGWWALDFTSLCKSRSSAAWMALGRVGCCTSRLASQNLGLSITPPNFTTTTATHTTARLRRSLPGV